MPYAAQATRAGVSPGSKIHARPKSMNLQTGPGAIMAVWRTNPQYSERASHRPPPGRGTASRGPTNSQATDTPYARDPEGTSSRFTPRTSNRRRLPLALCHLQGPPQTKP